MYVSTYCMAIHLTLLIPGLGFIAPVLLWIANKDRSEAVDRHGKNAINWLCSVFVYVLLAFVLIFMSPLKIPHNAFFLLPIVNIVFPLIAAAKANEGIEWKYPLSIPFFR